MMELILARRPDETQLFRATVTPKRGTMRTFTFRAPDAAQARQRIQKAASRRYPHGYSFSVRPLL